MKVAPNPIVSLMLLACLTGCGFPSTAQLDVEEIAAFYRVNATADAVEVSAQFFRWTTFPSCDDFVLDGNCGGEGTDEPLEVVEDRVTVTFNDDTLELARDPGLDFPLYRSTINAAAQTDDELVFTLERADGVALESSTTLPPPPVVAEIPDTFSRRDGLELVAEGDFGSDLLNGELIAPTDCINTLQSESGVGTLTLSFEQNQGEGTCDATLALGRLRTSGGNPAFAESDVEALRALEPVTIQTTP